MGGCFNLLTLQDKKNAKTNKKQNKTKNKSNLKGCGSNYFVSFIKFMSALNFICLALNANITWKTMHHVHLMMLMVNGAVQSRQTIRTVQDSVLPALQSVHASSRSLNRSLDIMSFIIRALDRPMVLCCLPRRRS